MPWGDPQDYWWLRREGSSSPLPAMQFGAQMRREMIATELKKKDMELEAARTGIQIQEYFSKKELQNKMMLGTSELAKSMAQFPDLTDPKIPETIYGVLSRNPALAPIAEQFLDNHRQALQFKQRQEQLSELRLSREQIAANTLAEQIAKREGMEAFTRQRLDILQQQADTGQMRAEDAAEFHKLKSDLDREKFVVKSDLDRDKFIEMNSERDKLHEEKSRRLDILQQQADTGALRVSDLKEYRTLITDLAQRKQASTEAERKLIHEEVARRLSVMEQNTATRLTRLNMQLQNLSPERRDLFKRDMDRLDVRAEKGDFIQKMPWGTKNIKYGPKYFEERKKLEDNYGVTEQAQPATAPLAAPLQKFRFDPETKRLVPIQ